MRLVGLYSPAVQTSSPSLAWLNPQQPAYKQAAAELPSLEEQAVKLAQANQADLGALYAADAAAGESGRRPPYAARNGVADVE